MTSTPFIEIGPWPGARAAWPVAAARLPHFFGLTGDAASRLRKLRALVIGVGSVGSEIALQLARLRIGSLYLVDPAKLKGESLLTHSCLLPEYVGRHKAVAVGQLCRRISPDTAVYAYVGTIQSLGLLAFAGVDVVLLASDNLSAEVFVGDCCQMWSRLLIQGSVQGEMLVAQTRVFANSNAASSCPACGFTADDIAALNRETVFSCAGPALAPQAGRGVIAPTMSTAFLCSLAADLILTHLCRHTLGLGKPLADSVIEYCGYTNLITTSPLARNPRCTGPHGAWRVVAPPRPVLTECTLRELARAAGLDGDPRLSVSLDDHLEFAEYAVCGCGHQQSMLRFTQPTEPSGRCPRCGGALFPRPFYAHRPVPAEILGPLLDRPLRALTSAEVRWVILRAEERTALLPYCMGMNGGSTT